MMLLPLAVLLLLLLPSTVLAEGRTLQPWDRNLTHVLMTEQARTKGAMCLVCSRPLPDAPCCGSQSINHAALRQDGSPGAFYWAPAWDKKLASTWVLFFEGGGWCYSEAGCVHRANNTNVGSTRTDKPTMSSEAPFKLGIFSRDPAMSPDFAGANHVYMRYCDGNSFAGDRESPVVTASG